MARLSLTACLVALLAAAAAVAVNASRLHPDGELWHWCAQHQCISSDLWLGMHYVSRIQQTREKAAPLPAFYTSESHESFLSLLTGSFLASPAVKLHQGHMQYCGNPSCHCSFALSLQRTPSSASCLAPGRTLATTSRCPTTSSTSRRTGGRCWRPVSGGQAHIGHALRCIVQRCVVLHCCPAGHFFSIVPQEWLCTNVASGQRFDMAELAQFPASTALIV